MQTRHYWHIVLFITMWACVLYYFQGLLWAQTSLDLFSPQVADQLRLTDEEWQESGIHIRNAALRRTRSANLTEGPQIEIVKPILAKDKTIETQTPTDLTILFYEKNAPVDMASLSITGKKGFFSKSLTNFFKKFIKGNQIEAKKVNIPSGKFLIYISIADMNGLNTKGTYRLKVIKQQFSYSQNPSQALWALQCKPIKMVRK